MLNNTTRLSESPFSNMGKHNFRCDVCTDELRGVGCVWDVGFLLNGDLVTACSDHAAHVFTSDITLLADDDQLAAFTSAVEMFKEAGVFHDSKHSWIRTLNSCVEMFMQGSASPKEANMYPPPMTGCVGVETLWSRTGVLAFTGTRSCAKPREKDERVPEGVSCVL